MTEYTCIPTSVLEDRKEAREFNMINQAVKARSDRDARQIEVAQQLEDTRHEATLHLCAESACIIAGIATLVFLAHVGAVAGWLMHVGTMAAAFWLGHEIGKVTG